MSKLTELKERIFVPNPSFTLKEQLGYCGGIFGNCMGQDSVGDGDIAQFRRVAALWREFSTKPIPVQVKR